jgi:hypothetical protein
MYAPGGNIYMGMNLGGKTMREHCLHQNHSGTMTDSAMFYLQLMPPLGSF